MQPSTSLANTKCERFWCIKEDLENFNDDRQWNFIIINSLELNNLNDIPYLDDTMITNTIPVTELTIGLRIFCFFQWVLWHYKTLSTGTNILYLKWHTHREVYASNNINCIYCKANEFEIMQYFTLNHFWDVDAKILGVLSSFVVLPTSYSNVMFLSESSYLSLRVI